MRQNLKNLITYIMFCFSETEIHAMTLAMQSDANRMVEEFQVTYYALPTVLDQR